MRKMIVVAAAMLAMVGVLAGCSEGTSKPASGTEGMSQQMGSKTKVPMAKPAPGSVMKGEQGTDMPAEGGSDTK